MDTDAYVLVTGGRDYSDHDTVAHWLWRAEIYVAPIIPTLVHGAARGADSLAEEVAGELFGWKTIAVPADWKQHGRAAGIIRNQAMLDNYPIRFCVAFPGGRGTANMVSRCHHANITVFGPEHNEFPNCSSM